MGKFKITKYNPMSTRSKKMELISERLAKYNDPEFRKNRLLYHLRHCSYKATIDNELVGFVVLGPNHPKSQDGVLYLPFIFVVEGYRRRGIATAMFKYASHQIEKYGCHSLFIESDNTLPDSEPFCDAMARKVEESGNNLTRV